jgi:hypothetical protein
VIHLEGILCFYLQIEGGLTMKNNSKSLRTPLVFLIIAAFATWAGSATWGSGQSSGIFQAYPIGTVTPTPPPFTPGPQPTLIPSPTPTPTPPPETRIALDYIATREGIPVEHLFPVNQHQREYGALGKTFWYVKALDRKSHHMYTAMVDLSDQSTVELEDIERAQREALEVKYGKLEPQLYELLQTKGPDDEVNVAVWFTPIDLQALLAELSARYPQVSLEALERPWHDVKDQALADRIRADYLQLMEEAHLAKQEALAQSLHVRAYEVKLHRGVPSLVARLPKRVILEISQRADVTRLYLIEGELVPLLDSAIPTARGNVVWRRGIEGAGQRVAILEPDTLPLYHPSICVLAVRNLSPLYHAAGVASAVASHHSTYKGMAPGACILSAGVDGQADQWDDVDDAILWAYERYARIMNASFTSETGEKSDNMQWIDRVFDYYARYYNITMIASAGNQEQGNHIGSPAKGYNVIAVGGTDDKNNSAWGDDEMWQNSAWKNPKRADGTYGDREKPEVVGAAKDLTLLDENNQPYVDSGTSYSAPQVAGLAALLADRNSDLVDEPEAMRAIIMASAVHNIDGPSGIPTGQDLKDGAGAIDAAVADTIAATGYSDVLQYPYPACESPCWWSNSVYNNLPGPQHFPPGSYRWYSFKASTGERIRVALAWVSNPAGPGSNYWEDPLETDLDLVIFDPDGQFVENGHSASNDNSYELVDFVAPKTGDYYIGVWKKPGTTEYANWIGIAWTKQATYLPDIKANYNGWTSELVIRNDGATSRDISTHFFDQDGNLVNGVTCFDVPSDGTCSFSASIAVNNFSGSAIVDGSEDVSVVVVNRKTGIYPQVMAYTGVPASDTGQTIWLPHVYRHYYNYNSHLSVQNTGSQEANVYLTFYNSGGTVEHASGVTHIQPNATHVFDLDDITALGGCFFGSAKVWGTQTLAVIADDGPIDPYGYKFGGRNYNGFSSGATTTYLPYLTKNYYGWYSCFTAKNTTDSPATVAITYYPPTGNEVTVYDSLAGQAMKAFCQSSVGGLPNGPLSAKVTTTRSVVVAANQVHDPTDQGMSYSGFQFATATVVLPWAAKAYQEGGRTWNGGLRVQNAGTASTSVTVRFYDQNGYYRAAYSLGSLAPGRSAAVYVPDVSGLPNGLHSAVVTVTAGQPIVAVGSGVCSSGCGGDTTFNYNGINR